MKENKAVNVTKKSLRHDFRRAYAYDTKHRVRHLVANCEVRRYDDDTRETGCQVDAKRDMTCTCKMKAARHHEAQYFSTLPEQVYAYHGVRSYTKIGDGNVRSIQRRKVRKIYLPEMDDRGVGSSEVSTVKIRKPGYLADSCMPKKTSSKCVGGVWRPATNTVSEKLSPIIKCVCATIGTEMSSTIPRKINVEMGNNTEHKKFATTTTQVETGDQDVYPPVLDRIKKDPSPKSVKEEQKVKSKVMSPKTKVYLARKAREEEIFSSDSLVQHVHDLQCPSSHEKQSRTLLDPMENKIEKEYRQIFDTKSKSKEPTPVKSTSLLRRRFEALRRGLKKEDKKKNVADTASSSPVSVCSHKDVSIVSDPPSLEARSYYDPKLYVPSAPKYDRASFRQSVTGKKDSSDSTKDDDNEFNQDVSGMFKLWGKKFNFEEDNTANVKLSSDASKDQENIKRILKTDSKDAEKKVGGKKFSFFKRKSKDRAKPERPYKTKKGLTTNRCEVKTGLVLKIGANPNAYDTPPPVTEAKVKTGNHEEMMRKEWLKKFLTNTIESRDSVNIRWNNKTYTTSSSTVFELMDNVYKQTGIVIRSKSDVQTNHNGYKSTTKKGNFVNQNIEAWMIPRTITDRLMVTPVNMNSAPQEGEMNIAKVRTSDEKLSIDKAKTFSHRVELVLHMNNTVEVDSNVSSDFLRIDIPDDFFSESCDDETRGSSDEKVHKIVEYETLKSKSDVRIKTDFDTGDHASNDIRLTVSVKDSQDVESKILQTVIKKVSTHRDVVIQGSNVCFPKRRDVIEVGILTQRELKPILKIHGDLSDEESTHFNPTNNCEFAESYLQDYYKQWVHLDMDGSTWRVGDSDARRPSERDSIITLNQDDGSNFCTDIYEDYQPTKLVTPSHSSCSHCHLFKDESKNKIYFGKVSKKKDAQQSPESDKKKQSGQEDQNIRVQPKDSIEVSKKRRTYAASNKSKWMCPSPDDGSTDRGAPDGFESCIKQCTPLKKRKPCKKNVSLLDCDFQPDLNADKELEGILAFKGSTGCSTCKKNSNLCPKTTKLDPQACDIPYDACDKEDLRPSSPPRTPPSPTGSNDTRMHGSNKCSLTKLENPMKQCPPPPPPSVKSKQKPPHNSPGSNICDTTPCKEIKKSIDSMPKKEPKQEKPVKCRIPPCTQPPPKCGACITPPCGNSQGGNSPPSATDSGQYPQKIPTATIPSPPQQKSPNKSAKCEPKCSFIPPSSPVGDKGVDAISPSPSLQASSFPPPTSSSPPHPSSPPVPLCSPTCPKTNHPKPALAKVPGNQFQSNSAPIFPPQSLPPHANPDYCTPPNRWSKSNPSIPVPYVDANPKGPEPGPACPVSPLECPRSCKKRPLISGLFLKKLPAKKKTCDTECSAWTSLDDFEHLNIRIKERSPSTDEIREMKIKDEDGRTLCERTEYKQKTRSVHRQAVLGEMYKGNICQRVSTKSAQIARSRDKLIPNVSSRSLDNIVEIQFTMKVTQGDKVTEICDGEEKTVELPKTHSRDVYVVNNAGTVAQEQVASDDAKNDVNIHIVIKNFKRKEKKLESDDKHIAGRANNEDFAGKISQKFHTVSTGYSDILQSDIDQNEEARHAFSIHRATWDLTGSEEKSKTQSKQSGDLSDFTDKEIKKATTSQSATRRIESVSVVDKLYTTAEEKSSCSEKVNNTKSESDKEVNKEHEMEINPTTDDTHLDIVENSNDGVSSDPVKPAKALSPKEEKKKRLKIVIEKAGKLKHKNKSKVSEITNMLKAIMTTSDSSDHADHAPVTNDLAQDITYASLKPNVFRNTESMNNFYRVNSMTSDNDFKQDSSDKTDKSGKSDNSFVREGKGCSGASCLCKTVAAKLKVKGGCCCSAPVKTYVNIETNCDIRSDEDMYVLNYGSSDYVDQETQRSRLSCSRANSATVSFNNTTKDIDVLSNIVHGTKSKPEKIVNKLSYNISAHDHQKMEEERKTSFHNDKILNLSDDDVIIANMEPKREVKDVDEIINANMEPKRVKVDTPHALETKETVCKEKPGSPQNADALQSYETKKAVLEIYTERTIRDGRKRLVAKLPKFALERESEIIEYEKICKRSFVVSYER